MRNNPELMVSHDNGSVDYRLGMWAGLNDHEDGRSPYQESIDLGEAFHPDTKLV